MDQILPLHLSKILNTKDLPSTANSNDLDPIGHHLDSPIREQKSWHTLVLADERERESKQWYELDSLFQDCI